MTSYIWLTSSTFLTVTSWSSLSDSVSEDSISVSLVSDSEDDNSFFLLFLSFLRSIVDIFMTKMIKLGNIDNGGGLFLLNVVTENASAGSSTEISGLIQSSSRQSYISTGCLLKNPVLLNLQKPMCEGHVQLSSHLIKFSLNEKAACCITKFGARIRICVVHRWPLACVGTFY